MAPTDEQIRLAIAQQAAEWFVAQRTSPLDEAERAAFAVWLKTSPVHIDEYLRMAAISGKLSLAAQDPQLPVAAWIAEAMSEAAGVEAPKVL
jgi:transmembrane sensor